MPVQEVACGRDVRAPRLLLSHAQLLSRHGLRRIVGVGALMAIDAGSFVLAVVLVSRATATGWNLLWSGQRWWSIPLAVGSIILVAALTGLYGRRYARHDARKIITAWTIALVAALVVMLVVDPFGIGASYIAAWLLGGAVALGGRFAYDLALASIYGPDGDAPPALLLGSLAACQTALATLAGLPHTNRVSVVGLVVPERESDVASGGVHAPHVVANDTRLGQALSDSGAVEVILADPASLNGRLRDIMDTCHDCGVSLKVISPELQLGSQPVTYIGGLDCPLFVVRPRPASATSYLVKRVGDRVGSVVLVVMLSPLLLVIALLIKATSPGPVFFVDRRMGVGQRPFDCYKFRTMIEDATACQSALEERNEAGGVLFKLRDDPRVTRVGRVLRRLSLDELPQLFNVLKGDMSLVGPRPLPMRDCELMEEWHRRRHVLLPGITGLWQVSGRSDLSFDDMVRLDLQYMETWSLKTDLYIMWRSVGAVLGSRGAY